MSPFEQELTLSVDGTTLEVSWEDNETVRELMDCAAEGSITVNTSLYGGFEQVGSLPRQFSRNDVQMTTAPGTLSCTRGISWCCSSAPIHGAIPNSGISTA